MWIPDEFFFSIELELEVPRIVKVGEWVVLDATRRSGPWRCVDDSEVPEGVIPLSYQPPEYEEHVAANLKWEVEPNTVRCNVPSPETIDFDTQYRKVMFLRPGSYKIRAITGFPTYCKTEWHTVVVTS